MSARPRPSAEALSATLARGARLHATQVPDDVVAAAHDARAMRRLQHRIARWQRIRRVW